MYFRKNTSYKNACIARDTANSIETRTVDLYSVRSAPRRRNAPALESDENAPPASVLARCTRTRMISKTDRITFAAKTKDCIPIIVS